MKIYCCLETCSSFKCQRKFSMWKLEGHFLVFWKLIQIIKSITISVSPDDSRRNTRDPCRLQISNSLECMAKRWRERWRWERGLCKRHLKLKMEFAIFSRFRNAHKQLQGPVADDFVSFRCSWVEHYLYCQRQLASKPCLHYPVRCSCQRLRFHLQELLRKMNTEIKKVSLKNQVFYFCVFFVRFYFSDINIFFMQRKFCLSCTYEYSSVPWRFFYCYVHFLREVFFLQQRECWQIGLTYRRLWGYCCCLTFWSKV